MFLVRLARGIIIRVVKVFLAFLRSRLWCSQRRKQREALATPYAGGPSKHVYVLLFSISRNLALLLKEASHVPYFKTLCFPRCSVTSFSRQKFFITFSRRIQRNLLKFSPLAPPALAERYSIHCKAVMSKHSRALMIDAMAGF